MEEAATQRISNPIEALSKDEIIAKYKGLLNIAKKAKQAKDDLTEENRQLKDALTRAAAKQSTLPAMQEMVQDLTEKNLLQAEQLSVLQRKVKEDAERQEQLEIENESLKRQLARLSDENDDLLSDVDRLEQAMQQVNALGTEQRKNLELLEVDINKMQEAEALNATLKQQIASAEEETQARVAELQQLQQKYQSVKDLNSEQRKKFNALKDRFIDVHRKLKNLKECKCVLLETQHEYAASVSKWQQEIVKASHLLFAKITALQQDNEELRAQLKTGNSDGLMRAHLLQKLEEMEQVSQLVKEHQLKQERELEELRNKGQHRHVLKIDHIIDKLEQMERLANLIKQQQSIQQQLQQPQGKQLDINRIIDRLNQMEHLTGLLGHQLHEKELEEKRLQQELKDLRVQLQESATKLAEKQSRVDQQLDECQEMELRAQLEASQATVAKLQEEMHIKAHSNKNIQQLSAENVELLDKLQAQKSQCASLQEHNEDLQGRYKQKESEHSELLAEMRELNEALKGRGDVISRLQEQHALEAKSVAAREKELQDSLSREQQALSQKSQQLEQLQAKVNELEQELQQQLQLQANADAQSDILSTSTISRAEELNRLRELDEGYEEKYNKLRTLAAKLKRKLQEQTQQLKDMEQQSITCGEMKAEMESVKQAQLQLQQDLNTARAENQKLKSKGGKNTSVLNLEIEAAEKSLADVSSKLAAKCSELEALQEALGSKDNANVQLRKEIEILEAAKNSEVEHAKQLKQEIDRMQAQLKDAVHSQQQTLTQNKELELSVEQLKLQLEELHLQLATSAQEHEKALKSSKQMASSSAQELQSRLDAMSELETNLRNAQRAHEDLRIEYLDYKVKAQSVLRKNQNKDSDKENELEAEITTLRAEEQKLRSSNEEQTKRLTILERELALLQEDNTNLQRRSKDLMGLVEELRTQNETLALDNHQQLQLQQERLHQHRQQIDHMDAAHKLQLQQLQQQLLESQEALKKVSSMPTAIPSSNVTSASSPPSAEQTKIDYLLMDHETAGDCTAADSLSQLAAQRKISTASRRSHDLMPLDELLALNTISSDTVTTISHFGRSVSMQDDVDSELEARGDFPAMQKAQAALQATKERLNIQESRVRHLTTLLAENEQDLARLTQMNDMLKEELRRQERSEEREQHMHNSEYLKNVFLKFLTLNNGDERMRLVPVLNTILRLSRNECEMLNCVAKGQKVSNDGGNRGWTGFLTAWSGGGGGGGGQNSQNNN
ncbi:GRIP and coiled-coil domain-containing protein 2 [Scaptodrosophila lebanonensis]|uniref:GRIP and coiled-coil domain-containing protein 2 n=1 Tax=Drosophila lebanonensis TaxID=7225 RepID=A0A6J2TE03_DROLE|nr:GRIP and coiled-coil domain-containing protein 2 [Scaptodrosophila lebanonensis]